MPNKPLKDYRFNDNDPQNTDLYDANFGNQVVQLSENVGKPKRIQLSSHLKNGWESYGGSFGEVFADVDLSGRVTMRGMIRNGNGANVAILPPELRPDKSVIQTCMASDNKPIRLDIYVTGEIFIAGSTVAGIFINLSDISYILK